MMSPSLGALQQTGDLEQGRLAGAARPDQGDDLAGADRQVDAAQHLEGTAGLLEPAPDADKFEDR